MTTIIPGLRFPSFALASALVAGSLGACAPALGEASEVPAPPDEIASPGRLPTPTYLLPSTSTPAAPIAPVPLTDPGCCAHAWWSDDGSQLLYVDDPPGEQMLGIYAVSVQGGEPVRLGAPSADPQELLRWRNEAAGAAFRVPMPKEARSASLSPDGGMQAWTIASGTFTNLDRRQTALWVAHTNTGEARRIATLIGGGLVGWDPTGNALLATGGPSGSPDRGLWLIPVDGQEWRLLEAATRIRGPLRSPGGSWMAYYRAFEADPADEGLWIVETTGDRVVHLPGLASYRWRDDARLLVFPFDPKGPLRLIEMDVVSGHSRLVAEEAAFPGGIAANDWSVSPDGSWLAYRSADEGRLWALSIDAR